MEELKRERGKLLDGSDEKANIQIRSAERVCGIMAW